ncbi:urease accessory protein UreE [Gymnodinialimonas sp.]
MDYGTAGQVLRAGEWNGAPVAQLVLDYEGRFLRRKRLVTQEGGSVLVDLAQTVSLEPGDALAAEGGLIEVAAAAEPVLRIKGDLVRLAWHIGNRHTPCEVAGDHIVIRQDHVLADMLVQLGAQVEAAEAPFRPEGGAYGHGRTHGHSHGPGDHAHGHNHGHDHGDKH